MFSRITSLLERYQALASNTAGLYLETLTSYLFPLITLPYLVRVLGPTGYGTLAFAQSLVGYLAVLVDYGFQLYGSRAAATTKDPLDLSRLFWNAVLARGLLFATIETLLFVLVPLVPPIREVASVVVIFSGLLLAQTVSPAWLYLGCQRMARLAKLNVVINVWAVALIFLLVKKPQDLPLLAAIVAFTPLVGNALAVLLAVRTWPLPWTRPTFKEARGLLRRAFPLFLASTGTTAYTTANAFLLGLFASKESVGLFAAAEKLIRACQRLLNPITTALFPVMVEAAQDSRATLYRRARTAAAGMLGLSMGAAFGLAVFSDQLASLLLGPNFGGSIAVLRVLAWLLPIIAGSTVLGLYGLLPLGRDKAFAGIVLAAGILHVSLAIFLVPSFAHMGMAWAVVITESFVTTACALALFSQTRQKRSENLRGTGGL